MRGIEILTLEVGSTITKANGFVRLTGGGLDHVAQGFAPTSVAEGDVGIGADAALADLAATSGLDPSGAETFVNSSAAGGLRMTVHGLTLSMTARAAREAALGAGGIVKMVTAGELDEFELDEIRRIRPNLILLAGGVDYGEKGIVLRNAEKLAALANGACGSNHANQANEEERTNAAKDGLPVPVLYAGNAALRRPIEALFRAAGVELHVAENVFPDVDVLNVEPLRRLVHEAFNRHIVHAPGMARLATLTRHGILPTPGAVLRAAELFAEVAGDCLVFDVGGATTDVHSVTEGGAEWHSRLLEPEPRAKRTVEGDLGVYVNARHVVELSGDTAAEAHLEDLAALPATERERALTRWLCEKAVAIGARRHAGVVSDLYTPTGRRQVVKGKDLTAVKWVVATGGALTKVDGAAECLRAVCTGAGRHLLPDPSATILVDADYRFSALGTLAHAFPDDVRATFRRWIEALTATA
ncbi:MAG TPA: glutamate mutase L [Thermoanaerobaculia bacterium]|nr:glutamate mutase L [Thermoanaerobaculia bacterium]